MKQTPPEVQEYLDILELARQRIANEPVADKERTARAMTEAWFRGKMDRERIDREIALHG